MSSGHFSRRFRAAFGESPYSYLLTRRIERAMALIRRGDLTITEICFTVGFSSLGTFGTRFSELVGLSPPRYRNGVAAGEQRLPTRARARANRSNGSHSPSTAACARTARAWAQPQTSPSPRWSMSRNLSLTEPSPSPGTNPAAGRCACSPNPRTSTPTNRSPTSMRTSGTTCSMPKVRRSGSTARTSRSTV